MENLCKKFPTMGIIATTFALLLLVVTPFTPQSYAKTVETNPVVIDALHKITAHAVASVAPKGFQLEVDDGVFNTTYHHFVYAGTANWPTPLTAGTAIVNFDTNGVTGGVYNPSNEPLGTVGKDIVIDLGQEGVLTVPDGKFLVFAPTTNGIVIQHDPGVANWTGNWSLVSTTGDQVEGKIVFQVTATKLYVVSYNIIIGPPQQYSFSLTTIT